MSSPSKKIRLTDRLIRKELLEEKAISLIKSTWHKNTSANSEILNKLGVEIINFPFPICLVHNFIADDNLLRSTIEEVKNVTFYDKSNDLYQFKQSDDLSNLNNFRNTKQIHEGIKTQGQEWVSKILGINDLNEDISATFSSYQKYDRLLCHDDKCGDRCIAFILYLVEDWSEADGGSLALFTTNENGHPDKIFKNIYPKFNTLVLFEVSHKSFHQVSEVLTENKTRLSLNGWFYSKSKILNPVECQASEQEESLANNEVYKFDDYFLKDYFEEHNIFKIRKQFCATSEIQLEKFLLPNFWNDVKKSFGAAEIKWQMKGPANMRKYESADPSTLPFPLKTLKNIFESKQWFKFLKSITSLDFDLPDNSDQKNWNDGILPSCTCEFQKWSRSNYTLIHDKNTEMHSEALDVILRIPTEENLEDYDFQDSEAPESGHVIYVDGESNDEECLLHIGYKFNSLALVYRDSKTLKFTKYLHSDSRPFYQVFGTFYPWRPPPDRPDLKHSVENESDEDTFDCDISGDEVVELQSDD